MKKATIGHIAENLKVSKATVSLVLNNKMNISISDETRRRVCDMAKQLNYRPNKLAQGLRIQKTNTIGVILADISNVFFARLARMIEDYAYRHNYQAIFCSSDENPEKEKKLIQIMIDRQVDGLILSSTQENISEIKQLNNRNFPIVLIDRQLKGLMMNNVIVDNFKGTFTAIEHLINLGHKKIGYVTHNPHIDSLNKRFEGYKNALKVNHIPFKKKYVKMVDYNNLKDSVTKSLKELLSPESGVSAIFFANNQLTIIAMECFSEWNLRIPHDISIISFDDIDMFRSSNPPITAVSQPIELIGENAVKILLQAIIQKGKKDSNKTIVLPVNLEVRRSCGNVFSKVMSEVLTNVN